MTTVKAAGKKGGSAKSDAKTAAARENAKKPRGKWISAVSFAYDDDRGERRSGLFMVRGKITEDAAIDAIHESWQARSWPIADITGCEIVSERFVL